MNRNTGMRKKSTLTHRKKRSHRKSYDDDINSKRSKNMNGDSQLPRNSEETKDKCDFCQQTAERNHSGEEESLLFCKDCRARAHPSCMSYSKSLAERALQSPWQCIDCKTCTVCCESGDPSTMLFCDECDKGYHMDCHSPAVTEKPIGNWACSQCSLPVENGTSFLPTPCESPVQLDQNTITLKPNSVILPTTIPIIADLLRPDQIPDAFEWNISQVVDYFKSVGFQAQAEVFKEQEIDGRSLLLLKRSDVLSGLNLKLGPALKIYTHVQRLQNNSKFV